MHKNQPSYIRKKKREGERGKKKGERMKKEKEKIKKERKGQNEISKTIPFTISSNLYKNNTRDHYCQGRQAFTTTYNHNKNKIAFLSSCKSQTVSTLLFI